MPVTKGQAQMLAELAKARRPHGAPRWDEPGIVAAIEKVRHLGLGEVMDALGKAADDREARTPAVITNVRSSYWRPEDPDRPRAREPYDAHGVCDSCGKDEQTCRRLWSRDHDYVSVAAARALGAVTPEKVAALKQEIACEDRRTETADAEYKPDPRAEAARAALTQEEA